MCRAGEANAGIELLIAALAIVRTSRHVPTEIITSCILGEGYWLAGEDDKARQTLDRASDIANLCGARYYFGWTQRLLGEISLKLNSNKGMSHFTKSIAVLEKIKAENELALAYTGYGRLLMQKGQMAKACEYLSKSLEIFERLGTLIEPEKLREILADLPEAGAM